MILAAIIAATSAIQAATAEHKLPAPMPEFKTPEQLVVWRKEMAAKAAAADAMAAMQANSEPSAFYTGKPFLSETGSYGFMFRQHDPEHCRWTTIDPSGFPDGANNNIYVINPICQMDIFGLNSAYSSNVDIQPVQFSISKAALGMLTAPEATAIQTAIQQGVQIAWQICARGVASYDKTNGTWANIQPFTIEGGAASRSISSGLSGIVDNVGFSGTYGFSVTLSYNGSPLTDGTTPYSNGHPASISLHDDLMATVTESISGTTNPGVNFTWSSSTNYDIQDPSLTIYE